MAPPWFRCQVCALPGGIESPRAGVYPPTSMRSKVPIVKASRVVLSFAGLVFAASCLDVTGNDAPADSAIRAVNATGQTLNLVVDGQLSVVGSEQPNVSLIQLQSGTH